MGAGAKRAALVAGALLLLGPAPSAAAPVGDGAPRFSVEAESVILRRNLAQAQKRAIENGFRIAVGRSARRALGSGQFFRHEKRIGRALLARSSRFIRSYRILEVKPDLAARVMRVRLEVEVDSAGVGEALRTLHLGEPAKAAARILFLVEERVMRAGRSSGRRSLRIGRDRMGAAERRLILRFAQAGYIPVDPRVQREPAEPGQIGAAVRGDIDAARSLGELCRCPLVITATAVAEREGSGAFVGFVNARIIRVRDGSVLAVRSRQARLRSARRGRGHEAVLAALGERLASTLLPEVRRAFPLPARARSAPRGGSGG